MQSLPCVGRQSRCRRMSRPERCVLFFAYHLVLTNSLPWKDPPFLIGKPSISMGHLFHGYVSHNQRVNTSYIIIHRFDSPSLGLKNSINTHSAAVKRQEARQLQRAGHGGNFPFFLNLWMVLRNHQFHKITCLIQPGRTNFDTLW